MWTIVFVTQNHDAALKVKDALEKIGILTKIKPTDRNCEHKDCFEVLVPYAEVNEALDVIIDMEV